MDRSQTGEGGETLTLSGSLTIAEASALRSALLEGLAACNDLQVDLSAVTDMDLTSLQLLCAAHHSAQLSGKLLRVAEPGLLKEIADAAGLQRHVGCGRQERWSGCLWEGSKNA